MKKYVTLNDEQLKLRKKYGLGDINANTNSVNSFSDETKTRPDAKIASNGIRKKSPLFDKRNK